MRAALLIFTLILITTIYAEEAVKLGFGSKQDSENIEASPGDNVSLRIYFFVDSEYGNRITHIRLTLATVPSGWSVKLDPPLHTVTLNISGKIITNDENLAVEPRPLLPQPGSDKTLSFFPSPSGKGYLQAQAVEIFVRIPQSAELGKSYPIKIEALASWFGNAGTLLFSQSRDFSFNINLRARDYSEQVIQTQNITQNQSQIPSAPTFSLANIPLVPLIAAALAVAIIILLASRLKPKAPGGRSGPMEWFRP